MPSTHGALERVQTAVFFPIQCDIYLSTFNAYTIHTFVQSMYFIVCCVKIKSSCFFLLRVRLSALWIMIVGALRCMTLYALEVVKKKLFSPSIITSDDAFIVIALILGINVSRTDRTDEISHAVEQTIHSTGITCHCTDDYYSSACITTYVCYWLCDGHWSCHAFISTKNKNLHIYMKIVEL